MFIKYEVFIGRVSTGPSKRYKALERLTFEIGLRKLNKALVLEMEPYKMKKKLLCQATNFFFQATTFFCQATTFFCQATTFFVERQKFFCRSSLINASIMTLQSLRKPYFSKVQFCRHPVMILG